MSRRADRNRRYHDRVAPRYDAVYAKDAYWEFYRAVTWEHLRRFVPSDLSRPVLDAGCGTGEWGLRLARSGYRVVLSDLSAEMLDQAAHRARDLGVEERVEFLRADICDLSALESGRFSLVVAEGDPLSFCDDARKALAEFRRVLGPGGTLVASVDHSAGAVEHFLAAPGRRAELERFLRTGRTEWLAHAADERFPVKMFTAEELETAVGAAGFAPRSLIAKTVLPLRSAPALLSDAREIREWAALESRLNSRRDLFARASHLEIAAVARA
jgi:ubiquinone/menaquinone biosynthesis C-methylase UbiE